MIIGYLQCAFGLSLLFGQQRCSAVLFLLEEDLKPSESSLSGSGCLSLVPQNSTERNWNHCRYYPDNFSEEVSEVLQSEKYRLASPILKNECYNNCTVLKPSQSIRQKVFICPCKPERMVLATNSRLFFTDDSFSSYTVMTMNRRMLGDRIANVESVTISDLSVLLVVNGWLFASDFSDTHLNFSRLSLRNGQSTILTLVAGVASAPICYYGNQVTTENSRVFAWSNHSLFDMNIKGEWHFRIVNTVWEEHLDREFRILYAQPGSNPDLSAVTVHTSRGITLLNCRNLGEENSKCNIITTSTQFSADVSSDALASASDSFLLWENASISVVMRNSPTSEIHTFGATIETLLLSNRRQDWLVKLRDGEVFHGNIFSTEFVKVNLTWNRNFTVLFRSDRTIELFRFYGDDLYHVQSLQLAGLVEAVKSSKELQQVMFYSSSSLTPNIMLLGSTSDSFSLNLTVLSVASDLCRPSIRVHGNFNHLRLKYDVTKDMTTRFLTKNAVLRERRVTVNVSVNCTVGPKNCPRGYEMIELSYIPCNKPGNSSEVIHGRSYLYAIKADCPVGLGLRLGNTAEGTVNCSWKEDFCFLRLMNGEQLFLEFHIYKYDKFVEQVQSDILLTEMKGITGFQYHDFNLLKKSCYQCSRFYNLSSPSQFVLQTVESACPCKVTVENRKRWIGNLSFANVHRSSKKMTLRFSAKVLSNSFCDLETEFVVELAPMPVLVFLFWEYIFMLACTLIASVSLWMSYHNYIKRMKHRLETEVSAGKIISPV